MALFRLYENILHFSWWYSPRRTGSVNIIMTRAVYSHTTLNAIQYYITLIHAMAILELKWDLGVWGLKLSRPMPTTQALPNTKTTVWVESIASSG